MTIWPGPGCGFGASVITRLCGGPYARHTIACMERTLPGGASRSSFRRPRIAMNTNHEPSAAQPRAFAGVADLEAARGARIGESAWISVTQAMIDESRLSVRKPCAIVV